MNNNIDNLVFQNHDTYVYYSEPILLSENRVKLPAVVNNNNDIVFYSNYITDIYTNGVKNGLFNVNRFTRQDANDDISTLTFIGTLTTPLGTLVFNYAGEIIKNNNLYVIGQNFVSYATYKGGEYGKYLNVKVSIDVSNNSYRVVTVSY
jgi:hypothetical protein